MDPWKDRRRAWSTWPPTPGYRAYLHEAQGEKLTGPQHRPAACPRTGTAPSTASTTTLTRQPQANDFPDMKLTSNPVLDRRPGPTRTTTCTTSPPRRHGPERSSAACCCRSVAQLFIEAYCVKMRGGTLRFQAQYLRRIRVPRPEDVSARDQQELTDAFDRRDVDKATTIALRVYGLEELA